MSLKTSLTVTATGEDAFKLLTPINEAGLGSSISGNSRRSPSEGGIDSMSFLGAVSDEVKWEEAAAGQGIVRTTEEAFSNSKIGLLRPTLPVRLRSAFVNGKNLLYCNYAEKSP